MITTDIVLVTLSLWLAFVLRLDQWYWPIKSQWWLFVLTPFLALPTFIRFGLYRTVVRYAGLKDMLAIIQATGLLVLLWFLVTTAVMPLYFGIEAVFPRYMNKAIMYPRSIPVLFWIILLLTIGGSRQAVRWLLAIPKTGIGAQNKKNILIYGAGYAGFQLASFLSHNKDIRVLGIIDDDHSLKGHYINNLKVLGDHTEIPRIRVKVNPLEVLLAMPKMEHEKRKELLRYLEDKHVAVRTVPSFENIVSGEATIGDLRNIDITDLLGRKVVEPNQKLLSACVENKNVMVTGAGGSIGSELCRQILPLKPNRIVLFEHSEQNLYAINLELTNYCKKINSNADVIPVLGSVVNRHRLEDVIENFKIDTIYHAAAYKHVTLLENNLEEGVRNNIFGTYNIAQASIDKGVESLIFISTDKAVRPTSAMGATKRIAELIIQGYSNNPEIKGSSKKVSTRFVIVRFGNVLGSSGSVIPLFQKQIASGGPITITHPEVTRYFMTISEASQLVLQAGSIGEDCGVFVLDMGKPVSILSLAKQMIFLSGHHLGGGGEGIEICYTGLRKGEKIHEELFIGQEVSSTEHSMIMKADEDFCALSEIEKMLADLESLGKYNEDEKRQKLIEYALTHTDRKSSLSD